MTHDEARALFSARIDGALADAEHARLAAHLGGCADCRRELERLERTVALLRGASPVHAPAGFAERVLAAARAARRRRLAGALFHPLRVKLPLQAAAVLLVAVAVTWIVRSGVEPPATARRDAPAERTTAVRDGGPPPAAERAQSERAADGPADRAASSLEQEDVQARARAERAERPAAPAARREAPAAAKADAGAPEEVVRATWTVTDRAAAVRDVEARAARLGGAARARHDEADATVVEVWLPAGAWDALARELGRDGRLRVDPGPAPRGAVRAVLRVTG